MSQAEALLNGLAVDEVATVSSPYVEVEPHIVIGVDRFIKVPDSLKRIAVQYDHNMRTVTFDCPRYYDGRDMSTMHVYIVVMGPNRARYGYIADNVRVDADDENMMHFDWTINRPMTDVKGSLAFLVCVRRADSEGNDVNHWNSELNTELYISEGMEYEETFEYEYPDIVSQLLDRMDSVEAIATPEAMQGYTDTWLREKSDDIIAEVADKGIEVLESIPADYTESYNLSNEAARTKGDAVVYEVEGKAIAVADSSDDYLRGLKLFGKTTQLTTAGKNLLDPSDTVFDYIINETGVVTSYPGFKYSKLIALPIGAYTFSVNAVIAGVTSRVHVYNIDGNWIRQAGIVTNTGSLSFDLADGEYGVKVSTYAQNCDLQIENGSTATEYEPYTGGMASPNPDYPQELDSIENPTVDVYGKNLLPFTYSDKSQTVNGATVTVNDDGSVTFSGTPTDYIGISLINSPPIWSGEITVALLGNFSNVVGEIQVIDSSNATLVGDRITSTYTINLDNYDDIKNLALVIKRKGNNTAMSGTVYPIVVAGNKIPEAYEPYKERKTIPITRTLRGIPVSQNGNYTDANDQQWICDEVDFERGVYVQRVGEYVVTGNENWQRSNLQLLEAQGLYRYDANSIPKTGSPLADALVTHFPYASSPNYVKGFWIFNDPNSRLALRVMWDYSTVEELKAFLSGQYSAGTPVVVKYVLAAPIETTLTAAELATFKYIHSNYPNTTVFNDSGAWMEMKYNVDTELFIKNTLGKPTDEQVNTAVTAWLEANFTNAEGVAY